MLLCFCFGSSAALFSVNATIGSINSVSNNFELYSESSGTLTCQIQATAISPFLVSADSINTAGSIIYNSSGKASGFSNSANNSAVYQQDIIVMVRLANNSNSDLFINTGYMSVGASLTNFSTTANIDPQWQGVSYENLGGNLLDVITTVGTSGNIQGRWASDFTYNSGLVIPKKSVLYSQIIFHIYTYDYNLTTFPITADKYAKKINSVNLVNPSSSLVRVIDDFVLMNSDYNSIEILSDLDMLYQKSVSILSSVDDVNYNIDALNTEMQKQFTDFQIHLNNLMHTQSQQLNNIRSEQQETNQNITAQTEQQEQQYNEFSANSDASDTNNVSNQITSSTNAVKEKVGLFSFFDNIVIGMSDIFEKNHERHLVLPALDVPLPEETVHIWDRKEFDFEELENNFSVIITVVRFATVAICYVAMINGAYAIFHKFFNMKDSGND